MAGVGRYGELTAQPLNLVVKSVEQNTTLSR